MNVRALTCDDVVADVGEHRLPIREDSNGFGVGQWVLPYRYIYIRVWLAMSSYFFQFSHGSLGSQATFFAPSSRSILPVGSRKRVQPGLVHLCARRQLTALNFCRLSERYCECASVMPQVMTWNMNERHQSV